MDSRGQVSASASPPTAPRHTRHIPCEGCGRVTEDYPESPRRCKCASASSNFPLWGTYCPDCADKQPKCTCCGAYVCEICRSPAVIGPTVCFSCASDKATPPVVPPEKPPKRNRSVPTTPVSSPVLRRVSSRSRAPPQRLQL